MALLSDRTELTTPADGDLYVTTDVSDTTDALTGTDKKITWANIKAGLKTYFDTLYAAALGADDNYVTDAEKIKLSNLSGTNTGDQDLSGYVTKVGTPANNQVGVWTGNGTIEGDTALTFDTATDTLTVAGNVAVTGTAGSGYLTLAAQASNPTSPAAGTLLLHSSTTQGFTRLEQDNEATTNLVLGRDNVFIAKNTSGGTINKGEVVYVSGSTGNIPNIAKAQANSSTTLPSVAVALDTILNNAFGQVMTVGIISGIDTSAFVSGDRVYVSTTVAGGLTSTRPSGTTNFVQRIGSVLVSGVGNGSLMVNVAPAILNMETGTNAATWTGNTVAGTTFEIGHASDTTLSRVSAGVVAVEGKNVALNGTGETLTTGTIELGAASDTTISRVSAGVVAIEGKNILTTDGGTLTGNITLGENTSIDLDPAGSADGKYSGICITGTAGAALAFGDLIYLAAADSRWELTDADATATAGTPLIGMCVLAAAGDGSATKILLQGTIRADAKFPALTVGAPAYVGETAGAIQTAIPTGADNVIRIVGRALTADELYFCPSQDHQITVA